MLKPDLKSKINQLWDRFWSGGISNPLTAIEQMSYLIFMKRLEDLDNQHMGLAEARGEKYNSIFKDHEDCRWNDWKHLRAEEMLDHVRTKVFPFIKELRRGEDTLFSENMKDAVFIIPKPSLLQEAVNIIDSLNISAQNQDVQGDIYEHLLSELKTSGKNGQFRTPRHIIKMMVELLNPKIGETICDPACGTGGFLINAYEYVLRTNTSKDIIEQDNEGQYHNLIGDKITKKEQWDFLRRKTLFGYDNDPTMVRIALMNMILHGIEIPQIKYSDGLSKNFDQKAMYDIILANPPFTGSIDKDDINNGFKVKTTKTELLFLELMYNLLHVGGRCSVIVPNGVLFGSSNAHKNIRKLLLENCQVEAIINMPSGVFQPYSGVGTSIIVFTKGGKTEKVWFYEMLSDGYSLDQKRERIDGFGDIPDIIQKFKNKENSDQSFSVEIKKIKDNDWSLSLQRYVKRNHEKTEYESSETIIRRTIEKEKKILDELSELKKETG